MFFILDSHHMVLLKDIWETYYLLMNDKNKYLENLKEINYFKKFFEIVTKFIVYSNLGKYFKIYKNKKEFIGSIDWMNYYKWLNQYPNLNKVIIEYNDEIVNDFNKIIGVK